MSVPKITDIRLLKELNGQAMQIDFDNERHFRVLVSYPFDRSKVVEALLHLAQIVGNDVVLIEAENPTVEQK